jgi:hypothetical protein
MEKLKRVTYHECYHSCIFILFSVALVMGVVTIVSNGIYNEYQQVPCHINNVKIDVSYDYERQRPVYVVIWNVTVGGYEYNIAKVFNSNGQAEEYTKYATDSCYQNQHEVVLTLPANYITYAIVTFTFTGAFTLMILPTLIFKVRERANNNQNYQPMVSMSQL